jgi:hypothetical protein
MLASFCPSVCLLPARHDPVVALHAPVNRQEVVGGPVGPGRNSLLQVALQLPFTRVDGQLYTPLTTATDSAAHAATASRQLHWRISAVCGF